MLPIHLPDDVFTLWLAPKYHLALSLFLLITLLLFSTSGSTTKPKPPSQRSPPEPGFISQLPQQEPGCPEPSSPRCWCWAQRTAALGQTQPARCPKHSQTRHKQPLLLGQLPPAPSQRALFAGKPNPTSNNRIRSGVFAELLSFLEEWGDADWAEKNWTLLKASQKYVSTVSLSFIMSINIWISLNHHMGGSGNALRWTRRVTQIKPETAVVQYPHTVAGFTCIYLEMHKVPWRQGSTPQGTENSEP